MTAALAAAVLVLAWPRLGPGTRSAGMGVVGVMLHPLAVVAVLGMAAWPFLPRQRPGRADEVVLADQVALALRAGLTLEGALREARSDLDGPLGDGVAGVLRSAHIGGLESALADASGHGERLYRITGRAVRTGAPLGPAVEALAEELRHEAHARKAAEARRLPVRLLLPLALLILPGFVLALVGPALAGSLARLDIGL